MNIRQAGPKDALVLSSLCVDVQRLHAEAYPELFKLPQREDFALEYFSDVLAEPGTTIYIAEEDGNAAGYIYCRALERLENPFTVSFRILLIEHISVRPMAQGRGIGMALMARARALAQELRVSRIQLDSWDFNVQAHGFFERLGYRKFNYRFWMEI